MSVSCGCHARVLANPTPKARDKKRERLPHILDASTRFECSSDHLQIQITSYLVSSRGHTLRLKVSRNIAMLVFFFTSALFF